MCPTGGLDRQAGALTQTDGRAGSNGADAGVGRDRTRSLQAYSHASERILREESLDAVCRLFLDTLRQNSGYGRAVLTLLDEQGRESEHFFTGFSDSEIDAFLSGRRHGDRKNALPFEGRDAVRAVFLAEVPPGRFGLPRDAERGVVHLPLAGEKSLIGSVLLFGAEGEIPPGPEDLAILDLLAGQVAHAVQKRHLVQKINAMQTRLLSLQSELMHAEKMSAIGLLVSGVTHELNNPLSGIMGFTQLLQQSEVNPRVRKHLDRIYNEAVRSQKIVQNLLSFSRRHKPEKSSQSLHEVIDGVLELRAYQLQVDDVEIIRRYDAQLPKTMLDFHQLQQVFLNVVNNAHHAMMEVHDRPRRLVVATGMHDGFLRASFTDSGTGIATERLESIFDPFFTTKKGGRGTGLGLSVSRAIIKDHEGILSAESRVGEGTTLHVDLPLLQDPHAGEASEGRDANPAAPGRPLRLLVVDDEAILVELLAEFLKSVGHSVQDARNGQLALELATANDYDVILTDLKMPGLDGQGLYERVCRIKPDMIRRFIFTTGDLANQRTQKFFQSCGCPYLSKPFKLEAVLKVLEQVGRAARAA